MHAKRREAGDASRRSILDAASRLIAERGYDGMSVSLLAKEVGLPTSSVYWHFGSKEGVMAAVMERGIDRFVAALARPAPDERAALGERLRADFTAAARVLIHNPEHAQFLQIQLRLRLTPGLLPGSDVQEAAARVRRRGAAFLADLIRAACAGLGPGEAAKLGDGLGDFAMSLIDGIFMVTRPPDAVRDVDALLDDAARALVAAANARLGARLLPDDPLTAPATPPVLPRVS